MEKITDKQAVCLITLFLFGSSIIIGAGGGAKNDAWIASILGLVMFAPFLFVYARIASLYPGKDLFEILCLVLGPVTGKLLSLIYIFYAFHLGALVLRNFGEFIRTAVMDMTPLIVPIILIALVGIVVSYLGVEVLGRAGTYALPVILGLLIFLIISGSSKYELSDLLPILENGLPPVIDGAFSTFSFPYAETLIFLGIFFSLQKNTSAYSVYIKGILLGGVFIIMITITDLLLLGQIKDMAYFPTYLAFSRINIGAFFGRFELIISLAFIVGIAVKFSICLITASRGVSAVFKLSSYRSVVVQIGILMAYLAYIIYTSTQEMSFWAFEIYKWYALPFQVILPLAIWIACEIKARKTR